MFNPDQMSDDMLTEWRAGNHQVVIARLSTLAPIEAAAITAHMTHAIMLSGGLGKAAAFVRKLDAAASK